VAATSALSGVTLLESVTETTFDADATLSFPWTFAMLTIV